MDEKFMKEKPILPLIFSMSAPMVISMLVNSLYNIIDSYFVAKISEDAMTALSLVYPIQNIVNAVAIGFGVGISAVISIYMGAGEREKANAAATRGFVLSLIHGVVMMVVSIAVMPAFLRMFTSSETVLDYGIRYSGIVFSFSVITAVSLAFEKIFQAVGRMKVTMIALMAGCVSNILLDPVLIFGAGTFPAFGIEGAAAATGIGQVISVLIYLIIYRLRPASARISRRYLKQGKGIGKEIYSVGIPAILNSALPSFLISALNAIFAVYGEMYVVILGIYYKLQTFLYLPANGFVQGMRPIIGYNYGAKEYKRVNRIYLYTLGMNGVIMLVGTVICLLVPDRIIGLYATNPETIDAGAAALRIISGGFLVSAVSVTSSGALEGMGKGTSSFVISLFRYVIIIIPAAYLLSRFLGAAAIWNCFWIAEAVTAGVSFDIYRKSSRTC